MPKRVALLQSNYIPWKGYFDIIGMVDVFIFHDDLQYTKGDWRNRNKIKTQGGVKWLTIPCGTDENRLICQVELKDHKWQKDHWNKIVGAYARSEHFEEYKEFFREMYLGKEWKNLSEMNQYMIKKIATEILGITTKFEDTRDYILQGVKADRVMELVKKAGATTYLSGSAAKDYLSPEDFEKAGIELEWMDYSGYPEYTQPFPPFEHAVSIIDLIFNEGPNAKQYLKAI